MGIFFFSMINNSFLLLNTQTLSKTSCKCTFGLCCLCSCQGSRVNNVSFPSNTQYSIQQFLIFFASPVALANQRLAASHHNSLLDDTSSSTKHYVIDFVHDCMKLTHFETVLILKQSTITAVNNININHFKVFFLYNSTGIISLALNLCREVIYIFKLSTFTKQPYKSTFKEN